MATHQRSDITVNGVPLRLYRPRGGPARGSQGTDQPQLASDTFEDRDLPLRIETWHLGAGHSQRWVPGTYAYASSGDGRFPRVFMPGPEVNLITLTGATDSARWAVDVGTDTYIGGGRFAYRAVNGSATSPLASVQDLGAANVGWSAIPWSGYGLVGTDASGTAGTLWKVTAGNVWSSGTANRKALTAAYYNSTNGFRQFGSTDTSGGNEIKTVPADGSDPLDNTKWGTPILVGDFGGIRINKLAALQDHVYVGTDRGLFDFDGSTGRAFNLTPFQRRDAENGMATAVGNYWVYWGHKHGLYRYQAQGLDKGITEDVSFGHGLPNETPIRGQVTAITQDKGWTVQAIWNTADTYICYGRDASGLMFDYTAGVGSVGRQAAGGTMLWHGGIIKLTGQQCYFLYISGSTDPPKLWFGNGANVGWCYLPRTENPLQDNEYRFSTSYSLFMPSEHWDRPATSKNLIQLDIEGDNLGVGASLDFKYSVDGGPYSQLGMASQSGLAHVLPGSEIIGRRISLKIDGTNTNTAGANLHAYILRAAERVTVRQLRTYEIDLEFNAPDRLGGHRPSTPLKLLDQLRGLEDAGQVSLRDEFGQTLTVLVKPPITWREERSDGINDKEQPEPHLVATLRVSVLKRLGSGVKTTWDSGALWDSGTYLWG